MLLALQAHPLYDFGQVKLLTAAGQGLWPSESWELTAWNTSRPSSVMNCSAVVTSSQGGGCPWLPDLAATAASTACRSDASSAALSSSSSSAGKDQDRTLPFHTCSCDVFSVKLSCRTLKTPMPCLLFCVTSPAERPAPGASVLAEHTLGSQEAAHLHTLGGAYASTQQTQ